MVGLWTNSPVTVSIRTRNRAATCCTLYNTRKNTMTLIRRNAMMKLVCIASVSMLGIAVAWVGATPVEMTGVSFLRGGTGTVVGDGCACAGVDSVSCPGVFCFGDTETCYSNPPLDAGTCDMETTDCWGPTCSSYPLSAVCE